MNQITIPRPRPRGLRPGPFLALAGLCALTAQAQTIPNPSFETDTFSVYPGYISDNGPISGWTASPAERVGLNPSGGAPFADNGAIPDGNNVAFIQVNTDDPATPATLSTTITDLVPGTTYRVSFRINARTGNTPHAKVYIDDVGALFPWGAVEGLSTASVGSSNPWWHVAFNFDAWTTSVVLKLANDAEGDQTLLVDDFHIEPSSGRWTIAEWYSDFDVGVDASYLYTHAYNLGSDESATINGVTFTGLAGANPAVEDRFSTTFLGSGPVADTSTGVSGDSAVMAGQFVYGGNVPAGLYQSIKLEGLTPGTEYVMTIYSVAWEDPGIGSRWATFSVGDDYLTVNQDQYYNDVGIRISHTYVADDTGTVTMKFAPFVPANVSFHVYGFSNREAVSRYVAPTITAEPRDVTVTAGLPVSFTVTANAVPTPTYQWRHNGTDLPGETADTLTIAAVDAAAAGSYEVVVANLAGSATSRAARLAVGIPMTNPSFEVDEFYSWPGYVAGNPGADDNGPITGWTSLDNHGLNPVLGAPANGPNPFADNGLVPHGTQVAFLQGPGMLSQTLTGLTVGGDYYLHYFENGRTSVTIPGMEVQVGGSTVVPAHRVLPVGAGKRYHEITSGMFTATAADLELAFIKSTNPAGTDSTALLDNVAVVAVPAGTPPSIGTQPQSVTVYLGEAASFSATAQGSQPLTYQWELNGEPVEGATEPILNLDAVTLADEGDYALVVSNDHGTATSSVARLSLLETIPSLRSTGIGADGQPLAAGSVDPYWTFLINPDGGSPDVFVGNEGWPIQAGVWMVNTDTSKWVGSRAAVGDGDIAAGTYSYRTTFDLSGRDTNTVQITGGWATDNTGVAVYVNGATVPVPLSTGFGAFTTFTITSDDVDFLQEENTLDFEMANAAAGPAGLRVEFTKTSARTLPGIPAGIGIGPAGGKYAEGDTTVLKVTATGTLPVDYQWMKNGTAIPGATGASLTLADLTTTDSGSYTVRVSNLWGNETSAAAVVTVAYRPLPGFFGTGVDDNGALLADAATDPHYTLTTSADLVYTGPAAIVVSNAWPIAPAGPWVANGPTSSWIAPHANQNQSGDPDNGVTAVGDYAYLTTFDLTGYDVSKVSVVGGIGADNSVTDVLINGASTGITSPGFGSLVPFTITTGLTEGVNTLEFLVNNAGETPGPTGLRVDLKGYLNIEGSGPSVQLEIARTGSTVSISWAPTAAGQKLLAAPAVTGPWTEIPDASNPYTVTATESQAFYRVEE
ncbi:MAG: immunoglobulin domain-containing protein [Verrucomicrobiales bacterium]|nr:immunoglobulin domain-containing protein [Verrucomicrobiales bacterium]